MSEAKPSDQGRPERSGDEREARGRTARPGQQRGRDARKGNIVPMFFSAVLVLLGLAIIARTLAAGGGPLAYGLLMGVIFVAAGVGRFVLERRR